VRWGWRRLGSVHFIRLTIDPGRRVGVPAEGYQSRTGAVRHRAHATSTKDEGMTATMTGPPRPPEPPQPASNTSPPLAPWNKARRGPPTQRSHRRRPRPPQILVTDSRLDIDVPLARYAISSLGALGFRIGDPTPSPPNRGRPHQLRSGRGETCVAIPTRAQSLMCPRQRGIRIRPHRQPQN
jgi:hypothetical protein